MVRQGKGDHVKIFMPNGKMLVFRGVGEVGIGILRDMIKRAGLSDEEFIGCLR